MNHAQVFQILSLTPTGFPLLLSLCLCFEPSGPETPRNLPAGNSNSASGSSSALQPAAASPAIGPGKALPQAYGARPTLALTPPAPTSSAAPGSLTAALPEHELLLKSAARLESRDFDGAILLLYRYLQRCPEAVIVRLQLGELLFRQSRWEESRWQFAIGVEQLEESPLLPVRYALHAHSRLMEIAQGQSEPFEEELHRGRGLLLLAEKRLAEPSTQDVPVEELLGKAVSAFQRARLVQPKDPRPALYLAQVWIFLQQFTNARLALEQSRLYALAFPLTPFQRVQLARLSLELSGK